MTEREPEFILPPTPRKEMEEVWEEFAYRFQPRDRDDTEIPPTPLHQPIQGPEIPKTLKPRRRSREGGIVYDL